jgi:uncharacterized membrane protein YdfJ with MMPL/SSD domain
VEGGQVLRDHPAVGLAHDEVDPAAELLVDHPGIVVGHAGNGVSGRHGFQGDHLSGLFGFTSVGYVQVYLPIIVFAVLFGLSMDYEVFLISRMHEQWLLTHDNDNSVATGVARTARPITAAALIMAAVFDCFPVADILELKEFGCLMVPAGAAP